MIQFLLYAQKFGFTNTVPFDTAENYTVLPVPMQALKHTLWSVFSCEKRPSCISLAYLNCAGSSRRRPTSSKPPLFNQKLSLQAPLPIALTFAANDQKRCYFPLNITVLFEAL